MQCEPKKQGSELSHSIVFAAQQDAAQAARMFLGHAGVSSSHPSGDAVLNGDLLLSKLQ
jgi:hypothetical protein